MLTMEELKGVYVPVVTPFMASSQELALDGFRRLLAALLEAGVDGLVINGTTGESPTVSQTEVALLLAAAREAVAAACAGREERGLLVGLLGREERGPLVGSPGREERGSLAGLPGRAERGPLVELPGCAERGPLVGLLGRAEWEPGGVVRPGAGANGGAAAGDAGIGVGSGSGGLAAAAADAAGFAAAAGSSGAAGTAHLVAASAAGSGSAAGLAGAGGAGIAGAAGRRVPIVVGTGTNDTAETVRRTARAAELGADAALVVTPYYNRPSPAGVVAHFRRVAEVGLPVIVYEIPHRTGLALPLDTIREILELDGVIGIKDSTAGVQLVTELSRLGSKPVLCGEDRQWFAALCCGAAGGMLASANVRTARFAGLYRSFAAGRTAEAKRAFDELLPLIRLLFAEPNPGPLKWLLAREGIIGSDAMRLPMTGISAPLQAELAAYL